MPSRLRAAVVVALVAGVLAGEACAAQSPLRAVGVRVVLPWTGLPLLVGVEGTANLSFGAGAVSFFLTTSGQALLTVSADVELSSPTNPISTAVRVTAGIAYLDPTASAPTPLIGGGVRYEVDLFDPILLGVAAEVLYPIAFPVPVVTASAGWSFP
jgi:hypothetical protein